MARDNQGGPGPKTSGTLPSDEGFLGRWSRRKAAAKQPAALPAAEADLPEESEQQSAGVAPSAVTNTEQETQLPEVALPDIDKMDAGSDFSVFMQAGVPPALKTKALRKLWRVKPELANLDGLIDYGEDLTGSFKVVDHLKTAYEVGKGFLKDDDEEKKSDEVVADAADNRTSGDLPSALGGDELKKSNLAADDDPGENDARQEAASKERVVKS